MSEHKSIWMALSAAQAVMPPAVKDAKNPHFNSKYADLAGVVEAVRRPLTTNGICWTHYTRTDETGRWMVTRLHHGPSDTFTECAVELIVGKNDMQGYKSATTYAKRIGLESVTGLPTEDDDGNAAAKSPPAQSRTFKRNGTPHDPETGEVIPPPDAEPRNPAQAASEGLQDAWLDGIRDSLPANYTPQALYEGISEALITAFSAKKSANGVKAQWEKRAKLINEMEMIAPDAYRSTVDAFMSAMRKFREDDEPDHVGSEFGLPA